MRTSAGGVGPVLRRAGLAMADGVVARDRPEAPRSRSRSRRVQSWLPVVLAPFVLSASLAAASSELPGSSPALDVASVASAVAVAVLGLRPLTSWRIAALTFAAWSFLGPAASNGHFAVPWVQAITLLAAAVVVMLRYPRGLAWASWAWTAALVVVGGVGAAGAGWLVALTLVALLVDARRQRARAQADARRERLTRAEQEAQRLVLQERARIARDLHDVVAHHMSMVAVQAETAPYRLAGLDEATRKEFASIAASARSALGDVREILTVLRAEDAEAARAPQPTLTDVGALVDAARAAGADVTLDVTGDVRRLGTALEVGAYRVIQEALANAARHAPGARTAVALRYGRDELSVTVRNDAPPDRGPEPDHDSGVGGHGLVGMRESAALLGGKLTAGPTAEGGFHMTARFPTEVSR